MEIPIRHRILVATPTHSGSVSAEMAQTVQLATIGCLLRGVLLDWRFVIGNSLVQTARNWLAAEFLSDPQYTHIMWWDDDIGADPDGIIKLLESGKDVVAGAYLVKQPSSFYPYMPTGPVVDNLQPVSRIASGFMLIKREPFEAIAWACDTYVMKTQGKERLVPHIFDIALIPSHKNPEEKQCLGEDFVLCQRLLEAGFEIYARTDIKIAHYGRIAYTGCLGEDIARDIAAAAEKG
jgi:hypothetical protein